MLKDIEINNWNNHLVILNFGETQPITRTTKVEHKAPGMCGQEYVWLRISLDRPTKDLHSKCKVTRNDMTQYFKYHFQFYDIEIDRNFSILIKGVIEILPYH